MMDKKAIVNIANKNLTAKAMFEHFRTRGRNPKDGIMDIRRAKYALQREGVDVVPAEFISNFKEMEKAGLGKLIFDKGKPMRFKWAVSMKEAAYLAALGTESPMTHKLSVAEPGAMIPGNYDLVIMLGKGREASFSLPVDVTRDEIDYIVRRLTARVR